MDVIQQAVKGICYLHLQTPKPIGTLFSWTANVVDYFFSDEIQKSFWRSKAKNSVFSVQAFIHRKALGFWKDVSCEILVFNVYCLNLKMFHFQ